MNEKKDLTTILSALIEDENSVQLTAEEQTILDEVMGLLDGFDKNLEALSHAKDKGLTTTQWMESQLRKSVKRIAKNDAEEDRLISAINQTIGDKLINQVTEDNQEQTSTNQQTEEAKQ